MVQVCHNTVGIFCQNGVGLQTAFNKTLKLSEGTNTYNRQSKRSEFAKLVSIHRYVTQVDIVIVTITCCAINHSLRSIFGGKLSIDLSNCQTACNRTNEYSGQNKRSKFTRLVPSLRYTLGFTVDICQSSLCLIVHLLRSIIREAFVV